MKIVKRKKYDSKYNERKMYGKRNGGTINLTAAVRDAILPHRKIDIDIIDNTVLITPTDRETGYALVICHGQAKFGWCYASRFIDIPESVELPITINSDGTLTMKIPEGDANVQ